MNIQRIVRLIICFFIISNPVFSQQKKDTVSGSPEFLFPEFTDGSVFLKDGTEAKVKLNYDAVWDQMQFMEADKVIMTIADPEKVVKIVISNRTFVYLKNNFVEVICQGPVSLYVRIHEQRIVKKASGYGGSSATTSVQSVSTFTGGDRSNGSLMNNDAVSYSKDMTLYLTVKGKTRVITNLNDLVKCFPLKKDLIKNESEKEQTQYNSIESVKKIVDWINQNAIEK